MGANTKELEKRVAASIFKALKRPEILRYMRVQVLNSVAENVETLSDSDVEQYILWMKDEQAKESR